MPLFYLVTEKYFGGYGRYWTNRYNVTATDLADASSVIAGVLAAEQAVHIAGVRITKVRVSDTVPNTDNFITQNVNLNCTGGAGALVALLAPFNCARVDFNVSGGGRPCMKYLRGCLDETETAYSGHGTTLTSRLQTYGDAIVAIAKMTDPQGNDLASASPFPFPQMHDISRASKKPSTP